LDKLPEESQVLFDRKEELKIEVRALEGSIREASEMIMRTDLINMKRVMRRLDMADKNDVPTLKGKVACSISATDEILITEMLFSGEFSDLEPHQVAAILSCLIYTDGKGSSEKDGQNKAQFKCEVLSKAF
jgi:ATP-dependent RNA helicase DOB1